MANIADFSYHSMLYSVHRNIPLRSSDPLKPLNSQIKRRDIFYISEKRKRIYIHDALHL
jgi:hypothetical protein